jgi:hypothetical protein
LLCGASLEERPDGLQDHPETDDCEVRFTDAWGVAVAPPQAPTPETAAPDEIDLKVYPTVDEVLAEIYAKANLPRLGGQSTGRGWSAYCVTPETRILTADLRWVQAGELRLGQKLFGFDEEPNGEGRRKPKSQLRDAKERTTGMNRGKRKLRQAVVKHTGLIRRRIMRLELEDGTILRASAEHPWLVADGKTDGFEWKSVEEIAAGLKAGFRRYIPRYFTPWETRTSYEAGYLAGLFDGEGHLGFSGARIGKPGRGCFRLAFAQNPNLVLAKGQRLITEAKFASVDHTSSLSYSNCRQIFVLGGNKEIFRFLGEMRPVRLLNKLTSWADRGGWLGEMPRTTRLEIVRVVDEGWGNVVALETSTKTYFAEGFAAHNSTFQRCPHLFKRKYVEQRQPGLFVESPSLAIGTLIHVFLASHYTRMIEPEYLLAPEVVHDAVKLYANPEFVGEAWRVFSAYRVYYSLEIIQPLAIEYDLKDPRTGESCRYDLIAYLPEGIAGYRPGTYVYEHKSASRFDSDTLEGWACDGEVIGQAALWKRLGLDLRFGKLQGVMINLLGKHKVPQFYRTLVSPDSIQIASHLDDLKRWESLIQLSTASNSFPRARGGCLGRYGRCVFFDECATVEEL